MDITWLHFIILGLASFRLTRLIVDDLIMEWLRRPFVTVRSVENDKGEIEEWVEPNGWIGEGITCQWCVGVWASAIIFFIYIMVPYGWFLILILSIAGFQSLLYSWSDHHGG
ncbi:DUF1360 domain-containing protein [Halobacillus locisalis]|uniref:DUF1360 domain-containing protein n=1 Tax=Halobacillus locisalis TaxID=220753 RepID=A0A838CR86_9BACI|nr:DUF1360 domain-containing protein [Halobacillus locisalis]MBA2174464.1 DUF1360 domain-containing protein [Halobacillus locisalis]